MLKMRDFWQYERHTTLGKIWMFFVGSPGLRRPSKEEVKGREKAREVDAMLNPSELQRRPICRWTMKMTA